MIKFKQIRFKNLASYGNTWTTFELNAIKKNLFQGPSGSGKSTLLQAICFGLFGKPFSNIRKNNLVNSINDSKLVVEVYFSKGKKDFKIIRGIKPNIFEIYENDILISQNASILDYQDFLEKQILKFNFKSFTQICVLGSANFIPFMQLPAAGRRAIIEEILDIKSFSLMNEYLKQDLSGLNEEIQTLEQEKNILKSEIEIHLQYKAKGESTFFEKEKKINKVLSEISEEREKISKNIHTLKSKENDISLQINKIENMIIMLSDKIKALEIKKEVELNRHKESLSFIENNNNCDYCLQNIDHQHKYFIKNKIDEILVSIESEYEKKIESLQLNLNKLKSSDKLKSFIETKTKISKAISDFEEKRRIGIYKEQALNQQFEELKVGVDQKYEMKIVDKNKKRLLVVEKKLEELVEEKYICEMASKLLKDDGIKTDIIKQYLPLINTLVNDYLQKMNFFVTFTLDENFNESIKTRGRDDFEYACYSEGEKQRLDLAILFTWRAIAKLKNSLYTNLLIMDEIADSKLNDEAAESVWDVLKSDEFKDTTIIVISHKNSIADKFEKVYTFKMVNNFSKVDVYN